MGSWLLILILLPTGESHDLYAQKVKPLLSAKCWACHGGVKQEADLRLDTASAIRQGGSSGPAVTAHETMQSLLLERVLSNDPDTRMPPPDSGVPLTQEEIDLLREWIDQGAAGPPDEEPEVDPHQHWAFVPPVRPTIPATLGDGWSQGPIDSFIHQKQLEAKIEPARTTSRLLWLRRVTLDLLGVPPSFEESLAFEADPRADAPDRMVDRLLASPAHGERWGRHWMDIWRYSDWWGLGPDVRNSQKHIWHWRDWIVESINEGVAYDEMVKQMLAADELHPTDWAKLRATGFLVRHYYKFNRNTWLEETMEHTGKAFLGLTLNCARCHDHKYDPVSQVEYYQLRAFFEPYQVRTDQLPGEMDFERDGLPRVYDCNLAEPTYVLARGDESKPIKENPLTPALPSILTRHTGSPSIEPVALPALAHSPGLRPWVVADYTKQANDQLSHRKAEHEKAATCVKNWLEASDSAKYPFESDAYAQTNDRWEPVTGSWVVADGTYRSTGEEVVHARTSWRGITPADFEASFRVQIRGARQWRSAGLAFDVKEDNHVGIYLSGAEGQSKAQVYYRVHGVDQYPAEGALARGIPLDQWISVAIRVRGRLVQVLIDGAPAILYQLPSERLGGRIELFTYDAMAAFDDWSIRPLPASLPMPDPGGSALPVSLEDALALHQSTQLGMQSATRYLEAVRARIEADQARLGSMATAEKGVLARRAFAAERALDYAQAQYDFEIIRRKDAKGATAEARQRLTDAIAALEKAEKRTAEESESYQPISGSKKAPESTLEPVESLTKLAPETSTGRRSALARWMTRPDHPLTARVAVNHVWNRHLGQALVKTVFDFGRKGARPTHPELLDYLANEFVERGWDVKQLHRDIVTSRTYALDTRGTTSVPIDQARTLYAVKPTVRMEAEVLRDSLLALAGELDLSMGGPTIDPTQQPEMRRRSLYFTHSHNDHHPFLETFDGASTRECYVRSSSVIPQQALALANSKLVLAAAQGMESRLSRAAAGAADDVFVDRIWIELVSERATEAERSACIQALARWKNGPASAGSSPRVRLIHSLMNHPDFIMIR